LNYNKVTP